MQIKASTNITQDQIKNLMRCNATLWINLTHNANKVTQLQSFENHLIMM